MAEVWKFTSLQPQMRPKSEEEARAFIQEMREHWGGFDEEGEAELKTTSTKLQNLMKGLVDDRVTRASDLLENARNLYTTPSRFIYELLQNADDAKYGTGPCWLKIVAYDDKIVVESNEKGFTAKDVAALCEVGRSSKRYDDTTTGEKGLGFKSVFKIADRVHIESGHWSFQFQLSQDNPIDMVKPHWLEKNPYTGYESGTRLTLFYDTLTDERGPEIFDALQSVSPDTLFALKRLQELTITSNIPNRRQHRTYRRSGSNTANTVQIRSTVNGRESVDLYKVFVYNDTIPIQERSRPNQLTEWTIAFRVGADGVPNPSPGGHYVYATLPVRRMSNLPFIVQANFTLTPSRENLNDSQWNKAIISKLPHCFTDAVRSFCKDDSPLRFQWLDYIPGSLATEDACWKGFRSDLLALLTSSAILETMSSPSLRFPRDVRLIPSSFSCDGAPLFNDLPEQDLYISTRYKKNHSQLLQELGVEELSEPEIIERMTADVHSSDSMLKRMPLGSGWHDIFLRMVNDLYEDDHMRDSICDLEVIPLSTNEWCSPREGSNVVLPYVNLQDGRTMDLPSKLQLKMLHPTACSDDDQVTERLYQKLGVSRISSEDVIAKIYQVFDRKSHKGGTVMDWVLLYEILFWQESFDVLVTEMPDLLAASNTKSLVAANKLYFYSDGPYHTYNLLTPTEMTEIKHGFLHQIYDRSEMEGFMRHGRSWKYWLEAVAGIRFYPPLFETKQGSPIVLHPVLGCLVKNHPEKFVATLHAHWYTSYEASYASCGQSLRNEIRQLSVPCSDGHVHKLETCILPTERIKELEREYQITNQLPLLVLPEAIAKDKENQWRFLENFGVHISTNRHVCIEMLAALKRTDQTGALLEKHCWEIYTRLNDTCTAKDWKDVMDDLEENEGILVSIDNSSSSDAKWKAPSECVWNGPFVLRKKTVLRIQYEDYNNAQKFFKEHLGIPDTTYEDIVEELKQLKEESEMIDGTAEELETEDEASKDSETEDETSEDYEVQSQQYDALDREQVKEIVGRLYESLDELTTTEPQIKKMRLDFHAHALLYGSNGWNARPSFVWNGRLPSKTSLESMYPHLKSFFVEKLGVKTLSSRVVVDEILNACRAPTRDESIFRSLLLSLGEIIQSEKPRNHFGGYSGELRNSKFLPLRGLSSTPVDLADEFFIVDSERFDSAFQDEQIQLLDFNTEDLAIVEPVFMSLNLQSRYLSKNVGIEMNTSDFDYDDLLSQYIRSRAYALSRCAVAHRSLRFLREKEIAYEILCYCEVRTRNDTLAFLVVTQNKKDIKVKSDRPAIMMKEEEGHLIIYAPSDDKALRSCLRSHLPKEFMRLFGIEASVNAERLIYRILTEDHEMLDEILVDEDVPGVSWLQIPETKHHAIPFQLVNNDGSLLKGAAIRQDSVNSLAASTRNDQSRSVVGDDDDDDDDGYNMFLRDSVMPQGRGDPIEMNARCPMYLSAKETGVAGELFVFELLNRENFPGFNTDNWKSVDRTLANVATGYNLSRQGLETADFEYQDVSGQFTRFLQNHTDSVFLRWSEPTKLCQAFEQLSLQESNRASPEDDADVHASTTEPEDGDWETDEDGDETGKSASSVPDDEPIKFLIEIKSTLGPCQTPFSVSPRQYGFMEQYCVRPNQRPSTIYVIFRVYRLATERIKFEVFVDPWSLRGNVLCFSHKNWQVTCP